MPPVTDPLNVVVVPVHIAAAPEIEPASAVPARVATVVYTSSELQPVVALLSVTENVVVPEIVVEGF